MLANLGGIIMLKKIGVLLVVLILSMLTVNVAFALPSNIESSNLGPKERVTDTNIIKITSIDKVSTKANKLGEKVGFKVKEDVILDNRTIIEKDCKVFGTITKLNKAAAWKHDGNIEITFPDGNKDSWLMHSVSKELDEGKLYVEVLQAIGEYKKEMRSNERK